jgi:hypothetical protein
MTRLKIYELNEKLKEMERDWFYFGDKAKDDRWMTDELDESNEPEPNYLDEKMNYTEPDYEIDPDYEYYPNDEFDPEEEIWLQVERDKNYLTADEIFLEISQEVENQSLDNRMNYTEPEDEFYYRECLKFDGKTNEEIDKEEMQEDWNYFGVPEENEEPYENFQVFAYDDFIYREGENRFDDEEERLKEFYRHNSRFEHWLFLNGLNYDDDDGQLSNLFDKIDYIDMHGSDDGFDNCYEYNEYYEIVLTRSTLEKQMKEEYNLRKFDALCNLSPNATDEEIEKYLYLYEYNSRKHKLPTEIERVRNYLCSEERINDFRFRSLNNMLGDPKPDAMSEKNQPIENEVWVEFGEIVEQVKSNRWTKEQLLELLDLSNKKDGLGNDVYEIQKIATKLEKSIASITRKLNSICTKFPELTFRNVKFCKWDDLKEHYVDAWSKYLEDRKSGVVASKIDQYLNSSK